MAIAQKLAGYSLGQADLLRRAMGKKKKEILDKEFVPVLRRACKDNGYSDEAIKALWDILVPFSDYAFNKAHTAGVRAGVVLDGLPQGELPGRVHGRAAHLASATTRTSRRIYLAECRRMGIKVLPPDVNESVADFAPVGTDIRFGLAAIRNVGANVVECDRRGPRAKGAYTDFSDFLRKVDASSATSGSSSR